MLARLAPMLVAVGLLACSGEDAPAIEDAPAAATPADPTKPTAATPNAPEAPATPARAPKATDLFTKTFGDAKNPAVIYVHGGPGSNGAMFEETIGPKLAEAGFFAVSYDQRGSARSPAAKTEELTVANFVQDLDDVIFTLKLDKPALMGHSWGGTLSLRYMEAHPGAVRGTVLVSNPIDFPDTLQNIHAQCTALYERRLFTGDQIAEVASLHDKMFPNGFTAPFEFDAADIGATMGKAMDCGLYFPAASSILGAITTWGKVLATSPNRGLLTEMNEQIPAAIQAHDKLFSQQLAPLATSQKENLWGIYGDADGLVTKKQRDQIQGIVGADRFTLLHGASHFAFMDDEDAFMEAFLADLAMMK